jgi:hypothetical protein
VTTRARCWGLSLVAVLASGCGGRARDPLVAPGVSGVSTDADAPARFRFDSLDARPVSSEASRGRVAVIVFVTTGNIASQAQVNYLAAMAKHDGEKVYYAMVVLEPKENREIVEIYRTNLHVPFPVALADPETMAGQGPFGGLDAVPVIVVLDREGRPVWRKPGLTKAEEIRSAMHGL